MERFTEKDENGYYIDGDTIYGAGGDPEKFRGDAIDRFAHYEDLEEQGRLVVLPCDEKTVLIKDGMEYKADHWSCILTAFRDDSTSPTGKRLTLFSRAEAEAAIAARGKEG